MIQYLKVKNEMCMSPVVKWAGGKRQIIDKLKNMYQMNMIRTTNHSSEEEHYYLNYHQRKQ